MTTHHELYYSNYCFFCQKVLLALRGRDHAIGLKSTSDADNRNALAKGGGKTQVPCLRIETQEGNVQWMYESDEILRYIRQQGLIAS